VYKVIHMCLMKEVLMYKVYLGINSKEPQNKGVITATQGSKLVNNTQAVKPKTQVKCRSSKLQPSLMVEVYQYANIAPCLVYIIKVLAVSS